MTSLAVLVAELGVARALETIAMIQYQEHVHSNTVVPASAQRHADTWAGAMSLRESCEDAVMNAISEGAGVGS